MMPDSAIAFACRSAIAVSCGSVLTADRPCSRRYCEIASAISSACAKEAVTAKMTPNETAFIHSPAFPATKERSSGPDKANMRHRVALGGSLGDEHFQSVEQRLGIELTLIDRRRRGAALEQDADRFPRRADGAFDGEGDFPGRLDVLADESEIGRPLRDRGR